MRPDGTRKVSILIPTFNQAAYLGQALESALAQDYPELEVVVSDDASTDGTRALMDECPDPRVRYVRNERNLGRTANYRRLLRELATGELALNLDGDDYLSDPSYITKAEALFREDPEVVLVFANQRILYEGLGVEEETRMDLPRVMDGNRLFRDYLRRGIHIPHLTALYDRRAALELDFYRADIESSDWESLLRLIVNRKVGFVPGVAGVWRTHPGSESLRADLGGDLANVAFVDAAWRHALAEGAFSERELGRWRRRLLGVVLRRSLGKHLSVGRRADAAAILRFAGRRDPVLALRLVFHVRTVVRFVLSLSRTADRAVRRLYALLAGRPLLP